MDFESWKFSESLFLFLNPIFHIFCFRWLLSTNVKRPRVTSNVNSICLRDLDLFFLSLRQWILHAFTETVLRKAWTVATTPYGNSVVDTASSCKSTNLLMFVVFAFHSILRNLDYLFSSRQYLEAFCVGLAPMKF